MLKADYLLDADIFRVYTTGDRKVREFVQANLASVWLSSVTVEEMMTGRLSLINRARGSKGLISLPDAHEELGNLVHDIRPFPVFVYSHEAEQVFRSFAPSTLRIGPQDCRLAAQALAHNLTIVTRNLRDFEAIGAPCIDWSGA